MTAGRELDALVAENVMGWKPHRLKTGRSVPECTVCGDAFHFHFTEANMHGVYWCEPRKGPGEIPPYSSDIEAAWPLVEKFRMDVQSPGAPQNGGEYLNETGEWEVEFFRDDGKTDFVNAPTAPLAICLAALKAKGVEVPA